MNVRRLVAAFAVLVSLATNGQSWDTAVRGDATLPAVSERLFAVLLPPCRTEDSDWCYWDAPHRGTGEGAHIGSSFITISDVTITFGKE